jgi:hypothetical protein
MNSTYNNRRPAATSGVIKDPRVALILGSIFGAILVVDIVANLTDASHPRLHLFRQSHPVPFWASLAVLLVGAFVAEAVAMASMFTKPK